MKKIFREIAKEESSDCQFLDKLACLCIDKVEDYQCASLLKLGNVSQPSRCTYIVASLWNAYSIGSNSGLIGLLKHPDLSISEITSNLNTIGCDNIVKTINKLENQIYELDLQIIKLPDEEKRKVYLDLAYGDWSYENNLIYHYEGFFIPKLRQYILENHLNL